MYQNRYDSHTHSYHSPDGNHSVYQLCYSAAEQGLLGIAITDHFECDENSPREEENLTAAVHNILAAKEMFRGKLLVSVGMELGQGVYDVERSERFLNAQPFDFVLGSIHRPIDNTTEIYHMPFGQMSMEEIHAYCAHYFQKIYELAQWGGFDVLAHLTLVDRYLASMQGIRLDFSRHDDCIESILTLCAQKGLGIEINASGLRGDLQDFMPLIRYVKRFRELGGEFVTLGSDAHYSEHVGKGIPEAMRALKESGFDTFSLYQNRKPMQIPIA